MFDTARLDVRYALRALFRAPGFAAAAALTLALGIGANTAIFSVVYGVLLRPLPFPEPDRLVVPIQVVDQYRGDMSVTYRQFRFLRDNARGFETAGAATSVGFNVFTGSEAFRVHGNRVSVDYFRTLGVAPALGRAFTADEDAEGGPAVLILSDELWRRQFGADSGVVGRAVSVDGRPFTVVGVMPAGFQPGVEAWSTLAQVSRTIGSGQNLQFVARLASGFTLAAAEAGLEPTVAAYREEFSGIVHPRLAIGLEPMRNAVVRDVETPVRVLFGAVGLVLLIACANVANLLLGRTAARGRELAVRAALGASRARVVRQLLSESVVLALVGGGLGLVVAWWGMSVLLALAPAGLAVWHDIRLDTWVLAFTAGVSALTGVMVGIAPAWRASRADLHESLKEGARATSAAGQGRMRAGLVIGEVALSLVLLVGAGLLIGTVRNLVRADPGFNARGLLTAEIWLTGTGRDSAGAVTSFYDELMRRLKALPGVRGAAVVESGLPLQRGGNAPIAVDGRNELNSVEYRTVTPGYLSALGVLLIRGRMLEPRDLEGAEPVVVVNRAFERRFFGDSSALDHTVNVFRSAETRRIVGVVGDVKSFVGAEAGPGIFITSSQTPIGYTRLFGSWFPTHVVVRTAGDPGALRDALARAIRETDLRVPVGRVRTMQEVLDGSLSFQRFLMLLLGAFAGVAIVLAAVGLYGVMSYIVTQRTHEIGVRMALGALPREVLGRVVGRGMLLAGAGAALGLAGAVALSRVLASQLFGVAPTDPATLAAVTALLLGVALLACLVPARRATRVDPITALRAE